jgi:hypothetical protein
VNELATTVQRKQEFVVLPNIRLDDEECSLHTLKTLCSRGHPIVCKRRGPIVGADREEWQHQKQLLEEALSTHHLLPWCGWGQSLQLLDDAGVRNVTRKVINVWVNMVEYTLTYKGEVVRTELRALGGKPSSAYLTKDHHWASSRKRVVYQVHLLLVPDSAAAILRWRAENTKDPNQADKMLRLANAISLLSARKNKDGVTLQEEVEQDLQKLQSAIANGELAGDGWKVQPNDYDWLLARRGRRDKD